jgi:hypothetical protein
MDKDRRAAWDWNRIDMGQKCDGYEADVGGQLKYPVWYGMETGRNRKDDHGKRMWQRDGNAMYM